MPDALIKLPADATAQGRAWPSPRTWDFVSRLVAAVGGGRHVGDHVGMIEACIGKGAALEFATFVREADLQDPEEILGDPPSYRHPARGDQRFAVMNAVVLAAGPAPTPAR